ncbi:MAG: tetratricopeptide repeat protein [Planctomycetota bacterium JB042]
MNRAGPSALVPLLLVGACSIGDSTLPTDPSPAGARRERLERARDLLEAGDAEAARSLLEAAFGEGEERLRERRLWQEAMIGLGREGEALERARRSVEAGGGADALVLLARLEPDDGQAESALQEALELDPDHAWAEYGLGVLAARRGDLEVAEKRLTAAIDADDGFEEALLRRAQVRDRLADFEGSADDYRAYLERRPEDVDALYDYATIVHRELFRPSEAEDLYRQLLRREPDHTEATVGLAVCLEERGRYEEAEELYLSVWSRAPSALFNLGMLYQDRLGRYAEARECFRRFLEIEPSPDGPAMSIADRLIYAPLRLEELERRLAHEGRAAGREVDG